MPRGISGRGAFPTVQQYFAECLLVYFFFFFFFAGLLTLESSLLATALDLLLFLVVSYLMSILSLVTSSNVKLSIFVSRTSRAFNNIALTISSSGHMKSICLPYHLR